MDNWVVTPIAAALLFAGCLTVFLAFYVWQKQDAIGRWMLAGYLAGTAIWCFTSGLEISTVVVAQKILISKIQYVGIYSAPVFLFLYFYDFASQREAHKDRRMLLLWIIPLITVGLAATNELHGLIWSGFRPDPLLGPHYMVYLRGTWFYVGVGYIYILLLLGTAFLVRSIREFEGIYRSQAIVLLIGMVFPWVANALYVFNLTPIRGVDFTPFGLVLAGVALAFGIYHFQLMDLTPVAQEVLINTIKDGMLAIDAKGRLIAYNLAARIMMESEGVDVNRGLIGHSYLKVLEPWVDLVEAIQTGLEEPVEIYDVGGIVRTIRVTKQLILDNESGFLIILYDITEFKQAQEAFIRQQRAISAIQERERMGRELHDSLGQVLNYINIQSKVILDLIEKGDTTTAAANLARLITVSQEANVDVRSFIQDTRPITSPQKAFFPALNQFVEKFKELTGIQAALSLPKDDIEDLIDPAAKIQVLRIIQEALSNTRKYARAQSIQIVFTPVEKNLQVVITDDGIGFDPEKVNTASHFGLGIMENRAHQAGGTLQIRSRPAEGTQVILTIPVVATYVRNTQLARHRIMIVDDHPLIQEALRNLITSRGINVVGVAGSGEEALEMVDKVEPDIILMDVQMPGLSGQETTRRIKQKYPDIKVLILTVSEKDEDLLEAIASGANGYLLKTQAPDELFSGLERLAREDFLVAPQMTRKMMERRAAPVDKPTQIQVTSTIYNLSAQEIEILEKLSEGMGYKEIGTYLHMSPYTVKYHFNKILDVMGVQTRAEAISLAIQSGLVRGRRRVDPEF